MSERRRRGKHRGAAMGPAGPMTPPRRATRNGPLLTSPPPPTPLRLFISRGTLSSRHMVPLIIVQFVINILLALLLNNQPQPHASPVGSSSSLSASLASTWPANLQPDSRDETRLAREASGVKFELFRGDKSSVSSSSSVAIQTQVHLRQRPRPHWRWLLANELDREVRAPDERGQARRHGNLLTIDEDEPGEVDGRDGADYDADNENSVRSREAAVRPELRPELVAGLMESTRANSDDKPPSGVGAESNPPQLAADLLLKLERRRRHHAHQEHDLSGAPSGSTKSLTSAPLNESGPGGKSADGKPARPLQIKTREQIQIAEQAYRNKLMELKQKYMTNRAINDLAYYVLLTIYASLITFGTISNSLICMTVILKPKILSPRNIFIVNLAGSDLLLCVFTMPFSFIEISMKMWQMGLIPCKLVSALQATSIFVSTISITAIALDRYKVIVYPTHQETASGARGAFLLLASVWIGALLLSLPLFWFRTVENYDNLLPQNGSLAHHGLRSSSGQQQQQQQAAASAAVTTSTDSIYHNNSGSGGPAHQADIVHHAPQLRPATLNQHDTIESIDFCVEKWPFDHGRGIYSVISMIFQYVLPITIVGVVYTKISHKLQKRLIRRQRLTQLECQQKRQLNLIKRTHTMLISVSLVFGLSWLPLNLLNVISDFSPGFRQLLDDQSFRVIFAICHLIGCSSACSNPVLYGFLNENFRKELRQVYNYYARRLVRLMRRLIGCRCCWLTRKLSQRCSGSRIDMSADEDEDEDDGELARQGDTRKHQNNGEENELAIKFTHGDSSSGGHAHSPGSSSNYSSSSSSSSGFDSSSHSSAPATSSGMSKLPQPQPQPQPASSLSLNLQTAGHAHHSMRSLPNEISVQALASSTLPARIRTSSNNEQVVVDLKVTSPEGNIATEHQAQPATQRASIQQSILETARRLSYQTIGSSRHTTLGGRTMRLCLCISGSSSAETLGGGAAALPVAINGIKLNRSPLALDFGGEETAQLETRIDDEAEVTTKRLNRKLRRRSKRKRQKEGLIQLECQCQCHTFESAHSPETRGHAPNDWQRAEDSRASKKYVNLTSEMPADDRRRTKFDSKSLDDEQAGSSQLAAGRRVWLRLRNGGGGIGSKSSGDLAVSSRGRASDAARVPVEIGHFMIDKGKTEKDELVKLGGVVHCNNCKHSSATDRRGGDGVRSSTSLKRQDNGTGESGHRRRHRRGRTEPGARNTKATIESQATKQSQLGAIPSRATAAQQRHDATKASRRRPLMSGIMSSFRLTRSSASSQDGNGSEHHRVPLKSCNANEQFQLPTLRLSQGGEIATLALNPILPSRTGDKRLAKQNLSTSGGAAGKQVGTVYLSIEMPSRQRGDSFVSTSGRERSTSVVVLDYEDDRDGEEMVELETRLVKDEIGLVEQEKGAHSPDEQQVATAGGNLDSPTKNESKTTTMTGQTKNAKPTADESGGERIKAIVTSQNSPSAAFPSSSSSSPSTASSSSFTSDCLLHSSSVFSSSCTCSTASSCSQTTSTNCHLTVGASSSGPQLIVQPSGVADESESAASRRRRGKKRSQSHERSPLALVTSIQSEGTGTGTRTDHEEKVEHGSNQLGSLHAASTAHATSGAQVWPRARSATAGSDLNVSAQAVRARLIIGQGYGLRPQASIAAPSLSDAIEVAFAPTATTSSCSIFTTTGGITTSGSSLASCHELLAADSEECELREKQDSSTVQEFRHHKNSSGDRKMAATTTSCNGRLVAPHAGRSAQDGTSENSSNK